MAAFTATTATNPPTSRKMIPYTVEFEYELEFKYLFMIPGSTIIPGEKVAVQHASYQLIFPKSWRPRYKAVNIDTQPEAGKTKDGREDNYMGFQKPEAA